MSPLKRPWYSNSQFATNNSCTKRILNCLFLSNSSLKKYWTDSDQRLILWVYLHKIPTCTEVENDQFSSGWSRQLGINAKWLLMVPNPSIGLEVHIILRFLRYFEFNWSKLLMVMGYFTFWLLISTEKGKIWKICIFKVAC